MLAPGVRPHPHPCLAFLEESSHGGEPTALSCPRPEVFQWVLCVYAHRGNRV